MRSTIECWQLTRSVRGQHQQPREHSTSSATIQHADIVDRLFVNNVMGADSDWLCLMFHGSEWSEFRMLCLSRSQFKSECCSTRYLGRQDLKLKKSTDS